MKSIIRAAISRLIVGVVFLFTCLFAIAGSGNIAGGGRMAGTAAVTYVPVKGGEGVFHVVYNNESGSRFILEILDQDGNELYKSAFTDKQFTRNFQLAEPEGYSKLVFVISNPKEKTVQRFEAEARTHLITDVEVKEVK